MNTNNIRVYTRAGTSMADAVAQSLKKKEDYTVTKKVPNALGQFDSYWKDYRHEDADTWK